jgi:transposase
MIQVDDLSRSLIAFEQISTLVIVVELSQSSWLAAGVVPGIERRPLKKLDPDPTALLHLVEGWRDRATKAGKAIHTDRSRFRVWARWVLAGSMAAGPWRRDLRHAFDERRGIARAPPSQDGSTRY